VKFDFLGLKTLTVIEHASQFIRRDVDEKFDIENVDLEDPSVYQLIAKGDNTGVFNSSRRG
jgi:DNA polymerase-3 subunit alpha